MYLKALGLGHWTITKFWGCQFGKKDTIKVHHILVTIKMTKVSIRDLSKMNSCKI